MFHFGDKVFSASWSDDESMMNVHAIGIALASIVLKEAAFHLTLRVGKRIESQAGTNGGTNSLFFSRRRVRKKALTEEVRVPEGRGLT